MSQQKDTAYLTISARVRAMENRLLTRERLERMIEARDDAEALKILAECGYPETAAPTAGALERTLAQARTELFRDMAAAVPDGRVVELFQLKYDYHNAKVLLKAQASGQDGERLMIRGGRYEPQALRERWQREELREFAPAFREALLRARDVLAASGDPQLSDLLLDRACYGEMTALARESGSAFLQGYVRLSVDAANLRICVRAARLERESDFLSRALLEGGNVSPQTLARTKGADLEERFRTGALSRAAALGARLAQPGAGPLTEFERECDNAVTAYLADQRRVPFGEQAVAGYLYAREAETTAIRTVMAGRFAALEPDVIRARLRDTYIS